MGSAREAKRPSHSSFSKRRDRQNTVRASVLLSFVLIPSFSLTRVGATSLGRTSCSLAAATVVLPPLLMLPKLSISSSGLMPSLLLQKDVLVVPTGSRGSCCWAASHIAAISVETQNWDGSSKSKTHWTHHTTTELNSSEPEVKCNFLFRNDLEGRLKNMCRPELVDFFLVRV